MNRLPPVGIINLFVSNRTGQGWSREKIVGALRTRLKWEQQDPDTMDEEQKARYEGIADMMRELEQEKRQQ